MKPRPHNMSYDWRAGTKQLVHNLGADSLDRVELALSFEDEFGCEIPDEAAESMFTVGDVIKFLETNAKS